MTKRMSRFLRIAVSIALLALVIAFADWKAVWEVLSTVDLRWVACALALAICDRVVINHRWQVLLAGLGVDLGFWPLFRVQLAANFAGSFLPSSFGVDALRVAALVRSGEPTAPIVAATLVDRFSLAFASLLFGCIMVVVLAQARVPADIANIVYAATAAAIVVCSLCLYPPVRRWARIALLSKVPQRFRSTVGDIAEAMLAYRRHWYALTLVTISTLVLFFVRILFAKSLGLACGIDIPILDLLLVIPLLWIVVMLPITIGAIGVQEAGYVVLMTLIGVGPALAVSMSLIEHLVVRAASLPGVVFIGEFIGTARKREIRQPSERSDDV